MARFAVLLRGINVCTAKRVAMAELRALLSEPGYTDIRTLLNSGNALVTGPDLAPDTQSRTVEDALRERFGFAVRVIVLTAEELRAIAVPDAQPEAFVAATLTRQRSQILPTLELYTEGVLTTRQLPDDYLVYTGDSPPTDPAPDDSAG